MSTGPAGIAVLPGLLFLGTRHRARPVTTDPQGWQTRPNSITLESWKSVVAVPLAW